MEKLRLSSNGVYLTFVIPLVVIVFVPIGVVFEGMAPLFSFVFLVPIGFWIYFISKARRVYYQDSSLYCYNLFSNKLQIITKDRLGNVDRWRVLDATNYKILYYDDDNNARTIYFMKNWFLPSFDTILDQLNAID